MDKKKFGSYIKESRINKNYTQKELADLLFVDVTTVSKWERGVSYPDITLVPDICKVLDISEHELIESSKDNEYRKIKKDARKFNNMKRGTFWTINISCLLAILTCFIVNIAVSKSLTWFFIVLTSIMCAYTFCPTITWIVPKFKKSVFMVSTFLSMLLLFFTCSVYADNYWFMIATLGVLLGYFIVFYPMLFKGQKERLDEEKYKKLSKWFLSSYIFGMVVITTLLLISIYLYVAFNLGMALLIMGGVYMIPMVFGILSLFEVNKSVHKILLFSLLAILVIAIIFGICRAIYLKSTTVSKTYLLEESYNDIKIDGTTLDVNIHLSNNENKVVYSENKKVTIEVKVIDDVLTINQSDDRKFYDMLFDFTNFKVDLYLTQELIDSLIIKGKTGDIDINKGFTFNNVDIDNSTGDIEFESNVNNNLTIVNSTGDVEIEKSNINGVVNIETKTGDIEMADVNCNELDIEISTGDTDLTNVIVTNDFKMKGSTGDLKFDGFDAKNIYVEVSTGSVNGTILSSKIFIAKSETGSVQVPETLTGGISKITTGTGNIRISYK